MNKNRIAYFIRLVPQWQPWSCPGRKALDRRDARGDGGPGSCFRACYAWKI